MQLLLRRTSDAVRTSRFSQETGLGGYWKSAPGDGYGYGSGAVADDGKLALCIRYCWCRVTTNRCPEGESGLPFSGAFDDQISEWRPQGASQSRGWLPVLFEVINYYCIYAGKFSSNLITLVNYPLNVRNGFRQYNLKV